MSSKVRELQPSDLWNRFADLNSIPRPSKHEEKVCAWIVEWAKEKGLEVEQDQVDNIIIRKPATPGMDCLLYTSPSPRDLSTSRMPSSA